MTEIIKSAGILRAETIAAEKAAAAVAEKAAAEKAAKSGWRVPFRDGWAWLCDDLPSKSTQ